MKKIAVCGCSWSAVSPFAEFKNTHWSELIANMFDSELHNFAVGGVSNFVIRLQIDEVLKLNPDLVIISPTYPDRIEVPFDINRPENKNIVLASIVNHHKEITQDQNINTSAIWDLKDKRYPHIKEYLTYYHLSEVKKKIDRWIIREGIQQLKLKGIPLLLHPQILWDEEDHIVEQIFDGILDSSDIIGKKQSLFYNIWEPKAEFDPGYHTSPNTQKQFAERLQKIIIDTKIKT